MIVPLDWGLGHATRCIPIIQEFLANNCNVIVAAETAAKSLLQHEFQQLTFIPIRGYRIHYSKKKALLPFAIMLQMPQILFAIFNEHQWLKKVVKKNKISAIISDNRFGLYHKTVPSVYITHQLLIKSSSRFLERLAQKIHFWFIKKYTYCWVPDFEGKPNIAGLLSHPSKYSAPVKYIGCLSRFEIKEAGEKKYDLVIIISGPEPQRSIFETLLLTQLRFYKGKVLFIRGLPGVNKKTTRPSPGATGFANLLIEEHLSAPELNEAIQQAKLVISRSGYTTIMDLVKLRQKAILVPTPGQTEQEYLAMHLMKEKFFYTSSQEGFSLTEAIKQAATFPYAMPVFDMEQYKKTVGRFVQSLE
ncbi:MAG: glycosyltransferase [Ferruginibacter sp.]